MREIVPEMFPPASLLASCICEITSVWVYIRIVLDYGGAGLT